MRTDFELFNMYMYNHFVRDTFGKRKVLEIRYSDVKTFYVSLLKDGTMKPNTIENVHTQIHPALQMAVRDGLIRMNPSNEVKLLYIVLVLAMTQEEMLKRFMILRQAA